MTLHKMIRENSMYATDRARNKGWSMVTDRPKLASDRPKIIIRGQIDRPPFVLP